MLLREQLEQPVLRVVRVLVLVDEDVAERLLPLLARLGEALEHLDGEHQHVVEVDGVRGVQPTLVEVVDVRDRLVVERGDALAVVVGRDQLVLRVRDLRVDPARDEALRVALELLEDVLDQPDLVGLVVDREVRLVAEVRRLPAQDAPAGGVEGEDPGAAGVLAEEVPLARAHLVGGAVREGDREDLVRLRADRADQVRDAVREHPRLARARAGDHEHRPLGVEHGVALGFVQPREVGFWRDDRHPGDASEEDGDGRRRFCARHRGARARERRTSAGRCGPRAQPDRADDDPARRGDRRGGARRDRPDPRVRGGRSGGRDRGGVVPRARRTGRARPRRHAAQLHQPRLRPARLWTVYAPPEHAPGTVHHTKAEADAAEEAH